MALSLAERSSMISNGFSDPNKSVLGLGYITMQLANGDTQDVYVTKEDSSLYGIASKINAMPEGAVNVTRPSDWCNPFKIGNWVHIDYALGSDYSISVEITRPLAVELFRSWAIPKYAAQIRAELVGKTLMCYCPLDQPCHADVLLEIANGGAS